MLKKVLNKVVGTLGMAAHVDDFHTEHVLTAVERSTRLHDMGEDDWQAPLGALLKGYREEAQLTPLGRLIAMTMVQGLLRNRLRTHDAYLRLSAPAPIHRPVFILGLPRTGSTLLHELLNVHEGLRAPLFWEADALPDGSLRDRGRIVESALRIKLLNSVAPEFPDIHPLGTRRPHECVTIQALAMRSMQLHAIHNIPSYTRWLASCDWAPAYLWHERYLQILQAMCAKVDQDANPRWLLKAPGHMHGISALLARYPSARFIQLHRDPKETVPSMGSLYLNLRKSSSGRVSASSVGRLVSDEWSDGLSRVMRERTAPDVDAKFMDIYFKDLVEAPVPTAEGICEFIECPVSSHSRQNMQRYVQRHHVSRRGQHKYELHEFGLTEACINSDFSKYKTAYFS